jgi:hypothetical protein
LDAEARHYQDQLHKVNQDRMDRIEGKLDRTLEAMLQIGEAIKIVPEMDKRIKALESERDQRKGALALLSVGCGLLGAGIEEVLRHWLKW